MFKKTYLLILGAAAGLALLLVGWGMFGASYTFQGSLIDPASPAPDIELQDQSGDLFRLGDQQGKVVLVFFGYTHCPDVCPITLTEFKQIKQDLGDLSDQVQFVFVTVDPERDTRQRIRQYLSSFDPEFIGLGGAREDLEPVWKSYGVYEAKHDPGSQGEDQVDHTSRVYAVDKEGNLRLTYPSEMGVAAMLEDVRYLVGEG
jgi:protein SCO1/2